MKSKNIEIALDEVLGRVKLGPAVFLLFDQTNTLAGIREAGEIPASISAVAQTGGSRKRIEEDAEKAGGCFCATPLFEWSDLGGLGAVFSEQRVSLPEMKEQLIELRGMLKLTAHTDEELKRYKMLYQVTKKFHSSMDVGGVLREIVHTLKELYPSFNCRLLLSHDGEYEEDLPIGFLKYGKDTVNVTAANAYLTGDIQFENPSKGKGQILYAPLKGRQGIYGVLEVASSHERSFPDTEVELIHLLAITGGNALENAKLYQQSQRLISDLQLVNKTSHRLNSNLRLSDTINFMTKQITRSFHSDEVGFVLFRSGENFHVLEGSTDYFFQKESQSFIRSAGQRLKKESEALFIGDLSKEVLDPGAPFRSFMGVPMIQNGQLQGMVVVLHRHPYQFSFDEFKLLQSLVHHSTLAFTNSLLHEELQKMVITDYLTGLYARHYLDDQIHTSMNTDECGCFILLDIDDFKVINDTHGHQAGDNVLIQVAEIIQKNCRDKDTAARWGGEEIAVYLPKVTREIGFKIARRLVKKIERGTEPKVTASCGISSWNKEDDENTVEALFFRADQALYAAKESGKNRVIVL